MADVIRRRGNEKLADVAKFSSLVNVRKATIDALAAYDTKSMPYITEVVNSSTTEPVRVHGLQAIKKLKEGTR